MNQRALFWTVLGLALLVFFFGGFANKVSNRVATENTPTDESSEVMEEDESINENDLVGTWRSSDDSKYTMAIQADGDYEAFYDGSPVSSGTWNIFTDIAEKGFIEGDLSFANDLYLEKKDANTGESFYYNIAAVSENELIITYLFGDVFRFERVN